MHQVAGTDVAYEPADTASRLQTPAEAGNNAAVTNAPSLGLLNGSSSAQPSHTDTLSVQAGSTSELQNVKPNIEGNGLAAKAVDAQAVPASSNDADRDESRDQVLHNNVQHVEETTAEQLRGQQSSHALQDHVEHMSTEVASDVQQLREFLR